MSSGLYADVAACGWNNGTKVQQWPIEPQGVGPGGYRFAVQNAGKQLDQGCTEAQGSPPFIWDRIPGRGCQNRRMPVAPANGVTVRWLPFTVETTA